MDVSGKSGKGGPSNLLINKKRLLALTSSNQGILLRIRPRTAYTDGYILAELEANLDVAVQLHSQAGDESEVAAGICEAGRLRDLLQGRLAQRLHLEWYDPVETPTVHAGIVESGILVYDSESA